MDHTSEPDTKAARTGVIDLDRHKDFMSDASQAAGVWTKDTRGIPLDLSTAVRRADDLRRMQYRAARRWQE